MLEYNWLFVREANALNNIFHLTHNRYIDSILDFNQIKSETDFYFFFSFSSRLCFWTLVHIFDWFKTPSFNSLLGVT